MSLSDTSKQEAVGHNFAPLEPGPRPSPARNGSAATQSSHRESTYSRIRSHVTRLRSHGAEAEEAEPEVDWSSLPALAAEKPTDRRLGLTWSNLSIKGVAAGGTITENVSSQFIPPFAKKNSFGKTAEKTIINNISGCVKPGEMLLLLGRPGAGCTSLLKVLGNRRKGFKEVTGDVMYGSLSHKEAKRYPGQIVMDEDENTFFPTLTAGETIDFATRLNNPHGSIEETRQATADFLFRMLNIAHTKETKVGNEYIRGVSGGEKKRIGILEVMAANASICLWDNSTRGLDASTALLYVQSVRKLTDYFGLTSICTLYQAGNGIYEQFDKVLVLDKGEQTYFGPRESARPFFEELGFICADGANVADFLTGMLWITY